MAAHTGVNPFSSLRATTDTESEVLSLSSFDSTSTAGTRRSAEETGPERASGCANAYTVYVPGQSS